jgi:ribosomal protein S18 acetylase RimI-like enzyme
MLSADSMNTNDIVLRPASVDDAEQIFALKRRVFGSTSLPFTIYKAERSLNYLREIIPADRFVVGALTSQVVGYYHAIHREDALLLNYIATSPQHRGNCIGTRLLEDCLTAAEGARVNAIELDVFESNAAAVCWYEKNGFKVVCGTHWYRISTRHVLPVDAPPTVLESELSQALAEEHQRGFSKIACAWQGGQLVAGLIAGDTCKLLESDETTAQNALRIMSSLFPSREYLIISSPDALEPSPPCIGHEHSFRMRKTL